MYPTQDLLLQLTGFFVVAKRLFEVLHLVNDGPHVGQRREGVPGFFSEHPPPPLQGGEIEHLCLFIRALHPQLARQFVRNVVGDSLIWKRRLGHLPQAPVLCDPLVRGRQQGGALVRRCDRLGAALPQEVNEPLLRLLVARAFLRPVEAIVRHPHRQQPVQDVLLRAHRLNQQLQAPKRLEVKRLVVEAFPVGDGREGPELADVCPPQHLKDGHREALYAPASGAGAAAQPAEGFEVGPAAGYAGLVEFAEEANEVFFGVCIQ
mmetsp:Transcript_30420/g.60412  ORF Transcript_30420/g.60412 Transcript_30420/m.60412 type:complete len:263 (-) Transcript_30420:310-1098(-)